MKQPWVGIRTLKCDEPPEHFAAIVSRHPHWCDLCGPLIGIENGRTAYICASVGEVHRPFGIMGKLREEFLSYSNHLVGLSARLRHSPRDKYILTVAISSSKRIKRNLAWSSLHPRQNHP